MIRKKILAVWLCVVMVATGFFVAIDTNSSAQNSSGEETNGVDEYFIYSKFDPPGISDVVGAGGYVEYYGVPEWGDEIQYVYFLSGNMGYKVKVWVTDGDGDGKIEPRQHPDHYLSGYVGPIEPRHFEIISSKDISGDTGGGHGHTEEFYVDSTAVYLGAYPNGIHKWDHDWNYLGRVANSPPTRTESMAYNSAENVWYAGGRYRTIYQLSDTDNDGSFLDESWVSIFTYPSYSGSHHDGMEYVGGYLWISDMTSDVIGKWQYNPTTSTWEELRRFTYSEPGDVEGMGFGPNDHFWCGSGWGSGSYIYELGNEITKGYPLADAGPDVDNHPPTIPIKFDASGSHHTDPAKEIVLYEWDFENDGTWDYSFGRFVYPTGKAGPYTYAGWLAGGPGMPPYQEDYYHLGQDMEANEGDDVYAIADGEIIYVSVSGWGEGNFGLLVKHKLNTGEEFLALYGHVRPNSGDLRRTISGPVDPPVLVMAGEVFATIGPYDSIPHLHFGIRPGGEVPPSPWGKMPIEHWPDTNGFVDPLEWITTRAPLKPVPLSAEHTYPAYYNPDGSIDWDKTVKDYIASLRVTDNSDPSLQDTDTCIVHITSPPWKPVADPDGPYEGHKKASIQLDGSNSYDPESKMYSSGHPWYETIAKYEWDLDHDGQFDDATGAKPTYTWNSEGLYIVGLKVTDSQPSGSGGTIGPLDVDIKYTTVVIGIGLIIATDFKISRDGYSFDNFGIIPGIDFGGHCYGMSETSILYYKDELDVRWYNSSANCAHDLTFNEALMEILWHQYSANNLISSTKLRLSLADHAQEYEKLRESISNGDPIMLVMQDAQGLIPPIHVVVAYKIVEKANIAEIYVYDNNDHDHHESRHATFNMVNGEFSYGGGYNKFIVDEAETLLKEQIWGSLLNFLFFNALLGSFGSTIALGCPADLMIVDQNGQKVGCVNETFTSSMIPVSGIVEGGFEAYALPKDRRYSIHVTGNAVGSYELAISRFTSESPLLAKVYILNTTEDISTKDRLVMTENENSICFSTNEDFKTYSFRVIGVTNSSSRNFTLSDIVIENGTIHTYTVLDWGNLTTANNTIILNITETGPGAINSTIYLTNGMNGTVMERNIKEFKIEYMMNETIDLMQTLDTISIKRNVKEKLNNTLTDVLSHLATALYYHTNPDLPDNVSVPQINDTCDRHLILARFMLCDFINQVEEYRDQDRISDEDADILIGDADTIIAQITRILEDEGPGPKPMDNDLPPTASLLNIKTFFATNIFILLIIALIGILMTAYPHYRDIKIDGDFEMYRKLGELSFKYGSNKTALEHFKKAIWLNPNDAMTWNDMGVVLKNKEKYRYALKCYDKAIEINPDYERAWYNKGCAFSQISDYYRAFDCFNKVVELNAENLDAVNMREETLSRMLRHN